MPTSRRWFAASIAFDFLKKIRPCLSDLPKNSFFPARKPALGYRKVAKEKPIRFGLFFFRY
jgi:hypothetical protein